MAVTKITTKYRSSMPIPMFLANRIFVLILRFHRAFLMSLFPRIWIVGPIYNTSILVQTMAQEFMRENSVSTVRDTRSV